MTDTPDVIASMRSALFFGRPAKRDRDEGPDESRQVFSFGPKPPCDLDLIDWADREAATLISLAEAHGGVRIGGAWRVNGEVRGLLYDDLRPVLTARDVILGLFDQGWNDETFEGAMRLVRRRSCKRFGFIGTEFDWEQDEVEQADQYALPIA
ncbi:hypothetical protein KDJ57_gp49 [Gordonia phage Catfish]|uniref:Uncharacterized protein n=1 Tax=Gordonia phage Catfish TaxID=2301538 RepID=A0A385D0N7_9CAUD|nr:hypothetical protein KDJ57_gp49 [Gordonia phage Catfish]AXQ51896.1 hypothetical protein SEA_CATFISH_60 [Gordonia phage Catfish]